MHTSSCASMYFYLLTLMMQAGNFTLKLAALTYIRKQNGKVRWPYFVSWRGFGPLFCTFNILMYFFFLNQHTFIWK